jgi:PAS domain S-box-containing protein
MLKKTAIFLFRSFRGRLILGVAIVHITIMSIFVIDLANRQLSFINYQRKISATLLAKTIIASSKGWISSLDVAGLQELVESQTIYPELEFASITNSNKQILAHTDKSKRGLYLENIPFSISESFIESKNSIVVFEPVYMESMHVGWVAIGIGQKQTSKEHFIILRDSLFYIIAAIIIGSLTAWYIGKLFTKRLYRIKTTIDNVKKGYLSERTIIPGEDEIALLSQEFNFMLDELERKNKELYMHKFNLEEIIASRTKQLLSVRDELETIIDNIPGLVYFTDVHHTILTVNKHFAQSYYTDKDTLKGKRLTDLFPISASDNYISLVNDIIREKRPRLFIEEFSQNILSKKWFSKSMIPVFDKENDISGILGLSIDITEQKIVEAKLNETEKRYQIIFEKAPDPYLIMEIDDGKILDCNKATEQILGSSKDKIIGFSSDKFSPPNQPDGKNSAIASRLKISQTVSSGINRFEWVHKNNQGVDFWVDVSLSVITLNDRSALFVAWRDITEKKSHEAEILQIQKQLKQNEQELKRSNTELEQFAFVASHDLRAPLRGIANIISWLHEDLGSIIADESAKHFKMLQGRLSRMNKLLDDLLEFARVGRGYGDGELINVKDLILDIVDMQGISDRFTVHCENLPVFTTWRIPLRQIFHNLISNTVKHHDKGTGTIKVTAIENAEFYLFSFIDDGPGIPEQFHQRAFELFQTLRPRDEVEGSGMGLAIIKKIVETVKGTVSIHLVTPRGTEIRFSWPKTITTFSQT